MTQQRGRHDLVAAVARLVDRGEHSVRVGERSDREEQVQHVEADGGGRWRWHAPILRAATRPPEAGAGGQKSPSGDENVGAATGASVTTASVVRNSPAIDAAFSNAERVTFAASMMPAETRFSNSPVAAL